jgi:signal transduction histidine kinase
VTGNQEHTDVVEGLTAGANDFVMKPYVPAELMARVGSLLRIRATHHATLAAATVYASRLREIFEQAPAAICLLEGPQHRFVLANTRYRALVAGRDVLGKSVAEALPEVTEQGYVALLDGVRRTGNAYVGSETWLKLSDGPDGNLRDVCLNFVYQPMLDDRGRVDSIFVHAVDVTEMTKARESAQRLAAERKTSYEILNHGDPVLILDADWRFNFANAAWLKLGQVRSEDVRGKTLWEIFPAALDPNRKYFEGYHRAMRERVPVHLTEYFAPLDLWTAVSVYPLEDGGIALFVRDVSQERRAEAEARSRAEFERQLIGIVSHDLRNPLSNILLGTQLLLRQELDGKSLRSLVRIQSSAQRGARMVRDLLDFTQARLGGGIALTRAPGNLHATVREVVEEAATTAPEREIDVATRGDADGVWDCERLSQVVHNLVGNALKYSPASSRVTVRSEADATHVAVSVHNVGAPIPPDALNRIFQPMQRATADLENTTRSVGLCLFIVKHLVDAHRGELSVTSTEAEGTTFTFRVPKHAAERSSSPQTSQ